MSNLAFIAPFFIVSDVKDSVSFYVDKLGFEIYYRAPESDPFFAMVGRDHAMIMLKAIAKEIKPIPNHTRHEWAGWDAFISAVDPDALFKEFSETGVAFYKRLHDNSDGLRGFEVADADGYILFFGRPKA